jgi:hypothetical protein
MAPMAWLVKAMADVEPGTLEIAEPEIATRARSSSGDSANDWLCAWCLNRVASEKDRFCYDGKNEFTFRNPEGVRFVILTFSRTIGCRQAGIPTLEDTWFPGHAWSYCLCDNCRTHLGWQYAGPSEFAGLIRDRIVRASLMLS